MKRIKSTCKGADSIPIDSIDEFQGNLKKLSKSNLDKLKRRIVRDGINVPLFIWRTNDWCRVLDGHQRLKALFSLRKDGYELPMIPVAYIEAENEKDARQKLLGITSQFGEFEIEELNEWMSEIDNDIAETLRFTEKEVKIKIEDDVINEDEDPGDCKKIVKHGDIIELNNHRILCGDSANEKDIKKLLNGMEYDFILTDPPFEMDIKFLNKYKNKFIMGADSQLIDLIKNDETFKYFIVHYYEFGFARSKHMPQNAHHLIGVFGEMKYSSIDGDILKTIIKAEQIIKGKEKYEKPVVVFEKIINHYSDRGKIILDLFLHSGTTIIACEKTGNICYGIEIKPSYCDVMVNRYSQFCIDNGIDYNILVNRKKINIS